MQGNVISLTWLMLQCAGISYYLPSKSKKVAEQSPYLKITTEQRAFLFTLTNIQTQKHKHLHGTWAHKGKNFLTLPLKGKIAPQPSGDSFIKICDEIQKVLLSPNTHTRRLISVVGVLFWLGIRLSLALESSAVRTSVPQLLMFVWYCPKEGWRREEFLTMSPKTD